MHAMIDILNFSRSLHTRNRKRIFVVTQTICAFPKIVWRNPTASLLSATRQSPSRCGKIRIGQHGLEALSQLLVVGRICGQNIQQTVKIHRSYGLAQSGGGMNCIKIWPHERCHANLRAMFRMAAADHRSAWCATPPINHASRMARLPPYRMQAGPFT